MAFRVFISYSTRDLEHAKQVKRLLDEVGAEAFIAQYSLDAGRQLAPEIERAIRDCNLFLLLWSSHARTSEWVPQEIGIAKAEEKPIIPVVLHKNIALPGFLQGLKYLPLYQDPEEALDWLKRNVLARVQKKKQKDQLVWLGIVGVVLWLLGQRES